MSIPRLTTAALNFNYNITPLINIPEYTLQSAHP